LRFHPTVVVYRRLLVRAVSLTLVTALGLSLSSVPAIARSKKLRPPPDVDLDPDRAMSFGRLSKNPFDRSVTRPFNQAISPALVMDSGVDPYSAVVRPSRYEPQTGEIRGGLIDKRREMLQREELDRPVRPASPAGFYKPKRPRTLGGQYVTPPTAQSAAGVRVNVNQPPPDFQSRTFSNLGKPSK
jgi:hypothetical protein